MKKRTKIILGSVLLVVLLGGGGLALKSAEGASKDEGRTVTVTRGTVVDRALAVGTIQPDVEVSVKSKISGVVKRRFADPGDFVKAGAPLLEIKPDPTPLELAEARRQLELRQLELATQKRELGRQEDLRKQGLVAPQAFDATKQAYDQAVLQVEMAKEKLALMDKGKVTMGKSEIESLVRAPISGYILEKKVEVGDPVVPLSSYQEGTVLMTMADMQHLIFRGDVDEIDVGRLREGMPVDIKVGALPDARIKGVLSKISLKAKKEETATTFPVEIRLTSTGGAMLRAGYSANAEIIIQRKEGVLQIPERVVTFDGDTAWVQVPGPDGQGQKRVIRTGLSDAINIEVVSGLKAGDKVLEKPVMDVK